MLNESPQIPQVAISVDDLIAIGQILVSYFCTAEKPHILFVMR